VHYAGRDAPPGESVHPPVEEADETGRSQRGRPARDQARHLQSQVEPLHSIAEIKRIKDQQQQHQPSFYWRYTGQPALVDGNQRIRISEKTLEFSLALLYT